MESRNSAGGMRGGFASVIIASSRDPRRSTLDPGGGHRPPARDLPVGRMPASATPKPSDRRRTRPTEPCLPASGRTAVAFRPTPRPPESHQRRPRPSRPDRGQPLPDGGMWNAASPERRRRGRVSPGCSGRSPCASRSQRRCGWHAPRTGVAHIDWLTAWQKHEILWYHPNVPMKVPDVQRLSTRRLGGFG